MAADSLPPRRTDVGLSDDLDIPLGAGETLPDLKQNVLASHLFRKWTGARDAEGLASEVAWRDSRKLIKDQGLDPKKFDQTSMLPLWRALTRNRAQIAAGEHDPNNLPLHLKAIYDDLRSPGRWVEMEQADSLDFATALGEEKARSLIAWDTENVVEAFAQNPEYFPRFWKMKGSNQPLKAGLTIPPHLKPRSGASFDEILELGLEPVTWDPYAAATIRRMNGVNYRENVKLVNRLFSRQLAKQRNAVQGVEGFEGWRKPNINSKVFDGRPIPAPTAGDDAPGQILMTPEIWVPSKVANFLEEVYGNFAIQVGFGDKDIMPLIRKSREVLKRVKLTGSTFQHFDFLTRGTGIGFTPTAIARGGPLRLPSLYARSIAASVFDGEWTAPVINMKLGRGNAARELMSNKPMFKDFAITKKMVVEEGLTVGGDISVIETQFVDQLTEMLGQSGLTPSVTKRLSDAQKFFQEGLFRGMYRVQMSDALDKFVVPALRRQHPNWTPRQVAAEAAMRTNEMFSSLGTWQSVMQFPVMKEVARTGMFSSNEAESFIRLGLKPFIGRSKRFATEMWLGWTLGIAGLAEVINFAATGKPLPIESFSPIKMDDPYAPFGIGYNTQLLGPMIPGMKGRNGYPLFLDIVGQMDTPLRMLLNPEEGLANRVNVLPRMILNQKRGAGFYGEEFGPINTRRGAARRAAQLALDASPILVTNILGAVRDQIPGLGEVITENEPRLGAGPQILQGFGPNIRAQGTGQLLDVAAQERFGANFRDIEPYQKDIVQEANAEELDLRAETSGRRAPRGDRFFSEKRDIEAERFKAQEGLVELFNNNDITRSDAQRSYFDNEQRARIKLEQSAVSNGQEFEAREARNENEAALQEYHGLSEKAIVNNNFVSERYSRLREELESGFTEEQLEYVRRNTNRKPLPEGVADILPAGTKRRIQQSQEARERALAGGVLEREVPEGGVATVPIAPAATPQPTPTPQALTRPTPTPEGRPPTPTPVPFASLRGPRRKPPMTGEKLEEKITFYEDRVLKPRYLEVLQEIIAADPDGEINQVVRSILGGQPLTLEFLNSDGGELLYLSIDEEFFLNKLPEPLRIFHRKS